MSRHQSHATVNANATTRRGVVAQSVQPPVQVSEPYSLDTSVFELDGRLTLVQERHFEWNVPAQQVFRHFDLEDINNPVNQLGPLHSADVPIVTNNDPVSYFAAVNKRSNFVQDGPADDITDPMFDKASSLIRALPRLFDTWDENDTDRERWLAKFSSGKRDRMQKAWEDIAIADKRELTTKTGSVKREVLVGKRFDKSAAGRIIYAGSDAFNALTGPFQMVAMERLVELLGHRDWDGKQVTLGEVHCMLGYKKDDQELASFIIDERFQSVVEGDFSRNDREQRKRVASLTDLWFEILGFPPWVRELMFLFEQYELVNHEFGLKVRLMYQLATGTTNTTFRNSTYNLTMFATTCALQGRRGKALILGDDLLAALNKRLNLDKWVETVADFKMVLKAKEPRLDGQATFLSRRIFAEVEKPFMIPLLGKTLVRFNARSNPNPAMTDEQYMSAKSLSYAFAYRHVHILRDFFLRRFEMEGSHMDYDIEEIGWNNRQFGYSVDDIFQKVTQAENLVDFYDFSKWCFDVYALDAIEVEELFEMTVCSRDVTILDDDRIRNMSCDFS
jgi:hypothetical protein